MSVHIANTRGRVLETAGPADIAGIVAIETHPSMVRYIGSWPIELHMRQVCDPQFRYYVVRDARGDIDGFAIVMAYAPKFHWFELSRIAVLEPGNRKGADLLEAVLDATFGEQQAHRIQLDCYEDNVRAQRAYARAGFRAEGLLRDAVRRDGVWTSLVLMAMLESDRVRAHDAESGSQVGR